MTHATALEKPKGPGYADLMHRIDDMVDRLTADYRAGRPLDWPVVPAKLLHRVWSDFVRDGHVRDEQALDRIFTSMRDNVLRLEIATVVAGHCEQSPGDLLDDRIAPGDMEPFCEWLIAGEDGWRISDYGLAPLQECIALAFEARTPAQRLKYLDRALNVTHQRGDLSKLFVEGGRRTVVEVTVTGDTPPVPEAPRQPRIGP